MAQANPASINEREPGELAASVGFEIIRRWLAKTPPPLYHHQDRHYYWGLLTKYGKWLPVDGDENNRQWTPNKEQSSAPSLSQSAS